MTERKPHSILRHLGRVQGYVDADPNRPGAREAHSRLITVYSEVESLLEQLEAARWQLEAIGAQVWINPILDWTKADCNRFMEAEGLRRNPVVDLLHRSGECLCGALAHWSEIRDIETWYPAAAAKLHEYEDVARENGHIEDVWARRLRNVSRQQQRFDLPLCVSCVSNQDRTPDEFDPATKSKEA